MARHTLSVTETNALLAATVNTLSKEDLQNLEDALDKKFIPSPTTAIGSLLP